MTSPVGGKPSYEGAGYEQVHSEGSGFGQDLSETSVRSMLGGGISAPFADAAGVFNEFVSGIASALGLLGDDMQWVKDGQEALNGRTDLLDPLLDYGSCSMPSGEPASGTGFLPFNRQIGPSRNITFVNNGMTLEAKGLWDLRLHATASWIKVLTSQLEVRLNVYRPDGSTYSQQIARARNDESHTITIVSSVVVPEPGYYVKAYVQTAAGTRSWLGGPAWSRMTAQHISYETEGSFFTGSEASDSSNQSG